MTFSIAGRCSRTGQLGIGIATSSPVVGSRCVHVSREAAVACQSVPDPRLGPRTLRLCSAQYAPNTNGNQPGIKKHERTNLEQISRRRKR